MKESGRPFFSVVVPVFRAEATLRRAAESIREQSEPSWEAVLVDDGSPDGSAKIARSLASEDPRFRVLSHPENRGTHEARRTGVAAARGEWILFLDPDDRLAPGLLERLRRRIAADPADILRFDFRYEDSQPVDPDQVRFHDARRCSGRSAHGPGCVLPMFFSGRNESMQLWSFAYRAAVCQEAFARTESARLVYAEDVYELFAIASLAESYGEESFPGYVYDAGAGGITGWRAERDRNPEAYAAGYFANLESRLASFAAIARYAASFRGSAKQAVRRAMRRERRRVLVGTIPWEFSVLSAAGVPRREALRRAGSAFAPLARRDRALLRAMLTVRPAMERLRLLPAAPCTRSAGGSAPRHGSKNRERFSDFRIDRSASPAARG